MKKEHLYEIGMISFGDLYTDSTVIEKDYSGAFKRLEKVSDKQHPQAILQLGIMYHYGYGIQQDIRRCEEIFNDPASDDVEFLERITILYHTHEGLQNFTKAFEWYNRLEHVADDESYLINYDMSQIGLGLLYQYGAGAQQDYEMAIKYYEELADYECAVGFYFLGLIFYYGKGVPTDYEKALYNFKKATDIYEAKYIFPFIEDRNDSDRNEFGNNRVYRVLDHDRMRSEAYIA